MKPTKSIIDIYNEKHLSGHQQQFLFVAETLENKGIDVEDVITQLIKYQIAIPSWALGTGGAIDPVALFRSAQVRKQCIDFCGKFAVTTGL